MCMKGGLKDNLHAHRRTTVYGVQLWAAQRLIENSVVIYGNIVTGTWALNAMYRVYGASIGSYCVIRNKTPAITVPDMLSFGKR